MDKVSKVNVIETRAAQVWKKEGICYVRIKNKSRVNLDDVMETDIVFEKFADGEKLLILADISQIRYVTFEARKYRATSPLNDQIMALVLIINNPVAKLIGNFFIGMNKPQFPVKLFNSKSDGVDWLRVHAQL